MARPAYSLAQPRPASLVVTALAGAALTAFADKTAFVQMVMPQKGKIIGITLNVNQKGGTHVTSTLDVLAGATSLLGAAFDVEALTAGTPVSKEGSDLSSAAASVAKDTLLKVTTVETGGTSPTWADVTLQIDYVPLGD
ncbi:MAG: hypothetical protein KJ018_22560 [Burkholderiales bacterium]|nr:hypothetical protein [Burkholderiales bacterium]